MQKYALSIGFVLVIGLVGSMALAGHYHRQVGHLEAQRQLAVQQAATLERALKQRRENAPDVVLEYAAPAAAVAPEGDAGNPEAETLRAQLQTLQNALAERDRRLAALQASATNRPSRGPDRSRFSPESLAQLQQTDPERYKEIVEQREAMRKTVNDAFAQQAAHLLESDASSLSEEEAAERVRMLDLINQTWQLSSQLFATTPPENRREVMDQIHENFHTLQPMLDAERDREFRALALEAGYTESESALFVDYVNSIIDATSTRQMRRNMWRGGPPPGPPPAGPTP